MSTASFTVAAPVPSAGLQQLAYPIFLAAVAMSTVWAITGEQNLALAGTGIIFGSIAFLVALEWIIPFETSWQPSSREWLRDFIYFGLNGAVDGGTKAGIAAAAIVLAPYFDWGAASLPVWASIPLAILVADFFGYWMHRKSHDFRWLWKVHGVHHAPDKVNTINNNTAHFLNIVLSSTAKTFPLLLLGFSEQAVFAASVFLTVQSFAVHANADLRLGVLNWLVMGPEHHRLHHSTVVAEAGNHATGLTLWDIVFGTFTWRPGRVPSGIGTSDPHNFPEPNRILANALVPFRRDASVDGGE